MAVAADKASRSRSYAAVMTVAGLYISGLVGAGFATGREIYVYFASYGIAGAIGLAVAGVLLTIGGARLVLLAYRLSKDDFEAVVRSISGRVTSKIIVIAATLLSYSGYVAVLASLRSVAAAIPIHIFKDELSQALLTVAAIAVSLLVLYGGTSRLVRICSAVTPVLIAAVILISLLSVVSFFMQGNETNANNSNNVFMTDITNIVYMPEIRELVSLMAGLLMYIGYNFLFAACILTRSSAQIRSTRQGIYGSVTGVGLFMAACFCILMSLFTMTEKDASVTMPMIQASYGVGHIVGNAAVCILGGIMLLSAVSGLSAFAAVTESMGVTRVFMRATSEQRTRTRIIGTVAATIALPMSYIGFDNIITKVYPALGLCGLLLLCGLLRGRRKE